MTYTDEINDYDIPVLKPITRMVIYFECIVVTPCKSFAENFQKMDEVLIFNYLTF